jgi:hypothetical protein
MSPSVGLLSQTLLIRQICPSCLPASHPPCPGPSPTHCYLSRKSSTFPQPWTLALSFCCALLHSMQCVRGLVPSHRIPPGPSSPLCWLLQPTGLSPWGYSILLTVPLDPPFCLLLDFDQPLRWDPWDHQLLTTQNELS